MATDNSSTLVQRSTKRFSYGNRFTEWENMVRRLPTPDCTSNQYQLMTANGCCDHYSQLPFHHYAIVFQDKDGAIEATGSGSFKDTHSWFTQDLRERFQDIIRNSSGQPTQLPSDRPDKRYRASVNDSDKQKTAVEVVPDYNAQQVTAQYWQNFSRLPQLDCRSIGQAWIELIEPNKQRIHPYSKGDNAKPKWWPADVRHASPHHLFTVGGSPILIC